jgi:hypothetical protein
VVRNDKSGDDSILKNIAVEWAADGIRGMLFRRGIFYAVDGRSFGKRKNLTEVISRTNETRGSTRKFGGSCLSAMDKKRRISPDKISRGQRFY